MPVLAAAVVEIGPAAVRRIAPSPAEADAGMTAAALAGIDGLDCTRGVSVVRGRWPTYLRILRTFVSTQGDAGPKLERALAEGRLVRLLGEYEPPPLPIHLLYPHARLLSPRVRCLVDWIVPRLRGMCVELAGERGGRDGKPT
mgnify:CR=1 FL=1